MVAVFSEYKVYEVDVGDTFIGSGTHAHSIFGKEYRKWQELNVKLETAHVDGFKKLMCEEDFNINDERFSKESLQSVKKKYYFQLLKEACELENADVVLHLLLIKDCSLSVDEQKTLLFFFVENNYAEGVKAMLKTSTKEVINSKNDEGYTPLQLLSKETAKYVCVYYTGRR